MSSYGRPAWEGLRSHDRLAKKEVVGLVAGKLAMKLRKMKHVAAGSRVGGR